MVRLHKELRDHDGVTACSRERFSSEELEEGSMCETEHPLAVFRTGSAKQPRPIGAELKELAGPTPSLAFLYTDGVLEVPSDALLNHSLRQATLSLLRLVNPLRDLLHDSIAVGVQLFWLFNVAMRVPRVKQKIGTLSINVASSARDRSALTVENAEQ